MKPSYRPKQAPRPAGAQTLPHPTEGTTMRYAAGFSCLGSGCPDNCCHDWSVPIDRQTLERLRKAAAQRKLSLAPIKNRKKSERSDRDFARILMLPDGLCPFLDADKLCRIHKSCGEQYLSDTCRTYPRQYLLLGSTLEMSMTLSCPEVAHRCLLDERGTELVALDLASLPSNFPVHYALEERAATSYQRQVDAVRQVFLQLLDLQPLPVTSRLFFCCLLADRISPAIHDRAGRIDPDLLPRELERFTGPGVMEDLGAQFEAIEPALDFSMSVIQSIVLERLSRRNECTELIRDVLQNYGVDTEYSGSTLELKAQEGTLAQRFEEIARTYMVRKKALNRLFGPRLDQYQQNYARNFWFRDLFIRSTSPLVHLRDLLLRLAIIKFLLLSRPELNDLLEKPEASASDIKLLDQVAVDTFYRFSRGVEHATHFLQKIHGAMEEQKLTSLPHLVLLLKF